MEKFIAFTAPMGKVDFFIKLFYFLLICGALNHLRDVLVHGLYDSRPFRTNLRDASFTAIPMCAFALLLIGHLNSLQARLYLQAMHDSLTDLPNRRWFMENSPDIVMAQQALMIVDIDHFKAVNDTFGHDVGDICLQHMAAHLQGCIGSAGRFARIGGEEFAAFLPNTGVEQIETICKNISVGFSLDTGGGQMHQTTASIGVAVAPHDQTLMQVLQHADAAAYEAKSRGRACFVVFHPQDQIVPVPSKAV